MSLLSDLKNLSNQSKINDFHKEFYTKFMYLPRLNNIQYILKYYKQNTYTYNDVNKYNYSKYVTEYDENNNIYYYREINHLSNMFDNDYYSTINVKNITCYNYNPVLRVKYISDYNPNIYYYITLTNDPVHKDHFVIINQNKELRAHHFYYPKKNYDILRDMININLKTGNYVYNSIELGSIPEVIHFHTSSEKPPLDTITNMVNIRHIIYANDGITFYKVINKKFICSKFYYITANYDKIDLLTQILPNSLLLSRYDDNFKYASQLFICPDNGNYLRIVITFRKVNSSYYRLENGRFPQIYFDSLFTVTQIKYNILGYESINIDETQINDKNYIASIIENKKNNMKYYCDNTFVYNVLFENILISQLTSKTNETNIKPILTSAPLPNNIMQLFHNMLKIIYKTNNKNIINKKIINNMLFTKMSIDKQYDISNYCYNGFINGKLNTIFTFDVNILENIEYKMVNNSTIIINNLLLYHILISMLIIYYEKRLCPEPLKIINNGEKYEIITTFVKTNLKTFIIFEKYNSALEVWINTFLMQILYSLYVLYKHYKLLYSDINTEDILISDDLFYNNNIEQHYVYDKTNTFVIDWSNQGNNCCSYGYTAYLSNFYKCSINLHNKTIVTDSFDTNNNFNNSIKKFINSLTNNLREQNIGHKYVYDLDNFVNNYNDKKTNIMNSLMNHPFFEQYRDNKRNHPHLYKIDNLLKTKTIFPAKNLEEFKKLILDNKNIIINKINEMYNNNIITIPKNTYFITGVANPYQVFNNDTNFAKKSMTELLWYYGWSQTLWFTSTYDIVNNHNIKSNNIHMHKIDATTADYYIGNNPYIDMSRHLIFKSTRDIKFLITNMNNITERELEHCKILLSIINNKNFDEKNLLKFLIKNDVREDLLVTLIYEILNENNALPFDGYIGIDYPELLRKHNNRNIVEYVIFNPQLHLKLLGVYHYDFIDSKYRLFMYKNNWYKYYESKIAEYVEIYEKFKHNRSNTCESLFKLFNINSNIINNCTDYNKVYFDIYNYDNINDMYIKNLYLICDELDNYNNFDFWNLEHENKVIEFDVYGNNNIVELV
ncbi:hypothetical protein Hokovirus_1_120 [Hokovirus HKV1]|uniref:Uncharacterized protein n=1 Tax=Hokovirus HKV1 TaxID=1977638 RepID=A0A1V0SEY9_9VIRU|nr:hypothetical protein Hokovirus_1_120 [Hokovirus HKV1]